MSNLILFIISQLASAFLVVGTLVFFLFIFNVVVITISIISDRLKNRL